MDGVTEYLTKNISMGFLLNFHDQELESRFWEQRLENRRGFFLVSMLLTIMALIMTSARFMPYISEILPLQLIGYDFTVRSLVICPLLLITLIAIKLGVKYLYIQYLLISCGVLAGVSFSALMWMCELDGITYYNYSFLHVLVFMYILLLAPIRKIFPAALLMITCHVVLSYFLIASLPLKQVLFIISPCVTLFFILTYAGYSIEKSERFNFIYSISLGNEYETRMQIQEQRSRWLKLVTDFLRHELRNSLIGVSSSLELINRKSKNTELERYIHRAEASTVFMKRLLEEASNSTSLESALNEMQLQEVNLSSFLGEKIEEYGDMYPGYAFSQDIESNLCISVDIERLVQALDKLINNAVEHCRSEKEISISLYLSSGDIHIRVANIGDPLDANADIFQPFVSSKASGSEHNHGLGLFVVKRIVEAHGGSVTAKTLTNPDGAEFTIALPG